MNRCVNIVQGRIREKLANGTNVSYRDSTGHFNDKVSIRWDKILVNLECSPKRTYITWSSKRHRDLLSYRFTNLKDTGSNDDNNLGKKYECVNWLMRRPWVKWNATEYSEPRKATVADGDPRRHEWLNASVRKYNIRYALGAWNVKYEWVSIQ